MVARTAFPSFGGVLMVGSGRLFMTGALMALFMAGASCTNVAEFDIVYESGLYRISPEDLSIEAVFPAVESPRSFTLHQGIVFVASSSGTVYSFDSVTTVMLGEHPVGPPSAAGYGVMLRSQKNTAYLISSHGNILELSLPECEVLDQFSVCPAPVDMVMTTGHNNFLWVRDGQNNRVHQVSTEDNIGLNSVNYTDATVVQCMEAGNSPDSLLVGTSMRGYKLSGTPGSLRNSALAEPLGSWMSLCAIPFEKRFVAVIGSRIGILEPYPDGFPPPDPYSHKVPIEGMSHLTAAAHDDNHVYVLSYLGEGTSRLSVYRYTSPYGIVRYSDLQGYPLQMQTTETGGLYVLLY
jgi:hypothetical protein